MMAFDPVYPGPQMPSRPAGGLNKLDLATKVPEFGTSYFNQPRKIRAEYELPVAPLRLVSCSESPFRFVLLRESESSLALAAAEHLRHWQH